jgi:hypothetical protein
MLRVLERMKRRGLDALIIHGYREHAANFA